MLSKCRVTHSHQSLPYRPPCPTDLLSLPAKCQVPFCQPFPWSASSNLTPLTLHILFLPISILPSPPLENPSRPIMHKMYKHAQVILPALTRVWIQSYLTEEDDRRKRKIKIRKKQKAKGKMGTRGRDERSEGQEKQQIPLRGHQ